MVIHHMRAYHEQRIQGYPPKKNKGDNMTTITSATRRIATVVFAAIMLVAFVTAMLIAFHTTAANGHQALHHASEDAHLAFEHVWDCCHIAA